MIIIPRRNLYLPECKWGQRRFQRGIIVAAAAYQHSILPAVPIFLAVNTGALDSATASPSFSINFGDEVGSNRGLVIIFMSEAANQRTHSLPVYDTVSGTLFSQHGGDGGQAMQMSYSWWPEADLPATSGLKTFSITLSGVNRGHMAAAYLMKDCQQTSMVGSFAGTASINVPAGFDSTQTIGAKDDFKLLGTGSGESGAFTYVAGDITAVTSNIDVRTEQNVRNNPGGAMRTGFNDRQATAAETYTWDHNYAASTDIDVVASSAVKVFPF